MRYQECEGQSDWTKYKEESIRLNQGDKFILYTDGVTETHDIKEELFGNERLIAFAQTHINDAADQFVPNLREELNRFSEGKALRNAHLSEALVYL